MTAASAKSYSQEMDHAPPRLRFAPSPNGELHLGHAYSALTTWAWAGQLGGEVVLRIEDIDVGRTRDRFVEGIYEDLAWLGLSWPEPVRRQSRHFEQYRKSAEQLRRAGLLYPCTATRKQIAAVVAGLSDWPSDPDGAPLYPGVARIATRDPVDQMLTKQTAKAETALRLDMDRAMKRVSGGPPLEFTALSEQGRKEKIPADPAVWGDAVLVRKDTPTSYHLSVVVDDALQGITHVTRGRDLEAATGLHVLLQHLLGLPTPVYHHHRLITNSQGRKLSKSFRDESLKSLREQGWTAEDVRKAVGCPLQ